MIKVFNTVYALLLLCVVAVTAALGLVIYLNTHSEEVPFACAVVDEAELYPALAVDRPLLEKHRYGRVLFENNCLPCHAMDYDVVGPALAGVEMRRDKAWLYQFIRNPRGLIDAGDSTAVALYQEYSQIVMPTFPFSEADLDSILVYIKLYDWPATAYPAGPDAMAIPEPFSKTSITPVNH